MARRAAEAVRSPGPAGLTVRSSAWTAHVEDASGLNGYPLVLPLIAWGYHRDHGRWMQACETWARAGVRMLNPPSVLAWNLDKSYLGRLADQGVAIPDTVWIDNPEQADVDAAFDRFGTDRLVVKPRVSGGAWKTLRLSRGDRLVDAPAGPAMIQPYLPTIESEGETSLLFFGGKLSHVVGSGRSPASSGSRSSTAAAIRRWPRPRQGRWPWRNGRWRPSAKTCSMPASTWRAAGTAAGC